MNLRHIAVLGGLLAASIFAFAPIQVPAAQTTAQQKKPAISGEASTALIGMGQTLRAEQFSFQARTIRVYSDEKDEPLHIFHTTKVVVHRPNRLLVDLTGDDGARKLVFDGKTVIAYLAAEQKYAGQSGQYRDDRRRPLPSHVLRAAARHRARALGGEECSVIASAADRDLPEFARPTQLHCRVLRLELQRPSVRRGFHLPTAAGCGSGAVEAPGRGDSNARQGQRG